ncbi:MAG: hypothetical protein NXI00_12230 [Cytophagales bacterium]|nr:hypothetical protein [Cytophagales bacterium]
MERWLTKEEFERLPEDLDFQMYDIMKDNECSAYLVEAEAESCIYKGSVNMWDYNSGQRWPEFENGVMVTELITPTV